MESDYKLMKKAELFAIRKHEGQLDDEGKDYFLAHIVPVVNMLEQITHDKKILAAGYLHDTLEDTNTTIKELKDEFGDTIANLVLELTHEGNKQDGYYFPRLKSKKAILIKFCDRASNLSRMGGWSESRQQHYLKKSKFWKSEL